MTEHEDARANLDRQIADFKMEGLVQTAATVERLKAAIDGSKPLDEIGILAVFAETLEELERRIVAIESRSD